MNAEQLLATRLATFAVAKVALHSSYVEVAPLATQSVERCLAPAMVEVVSATPLLLVRAAFVAVVPVPLVSQFQTAIGRWAPADPREAQTKLVQLQVQAVLVQLQTQTQLPLGYHISKHPLLWAIHIATDPLSWTYHTVTLKAPFAAHTKTLAKL